MNHLTIGNLKKHIFDLPDETPIFLGSEHTESGYHIDEKCVEKNGVLYLSLIWPNPNPDSAFTKIRAYPLKKTHYE